MPVAKRNFSLRHGHDGAPAADVRKGPQSKRAVPSTINVEVADPNKKTTAGHLASASIMPSVDTMEFTDDTRAKTKSDPPRKSSSSRKRGRKSHHTLLDGDNPSAMEDVVGESKKRSRNRKRDRKERRKRRKENPKEDTAPKRSSRHAAAEGNYVGGSSHEKAAGPAHSLDAIDEKRSLIWSTLLGRRPVADDGDEMSKWLMDIMAVSDLKAPIHEARIRALLGHDPHNHDSVSSPSTLSLDDS